jgi:DNA-binding MarR family transcriptional regulator
LVRARHDGAVSSTGTDRATELLVVMDALLYAQARSQREGRGETLTVLERSAYRSISDAFEAGQPLTPASLGAILGLRSGSVTVVVDRLEQAGLVARHRRSADRRLRTLEPTGAPDAAMELDWFSQHVVDSANGLSDEHWQIVHAALSEVVAAIEASARTGAKAAGDDDTGEQRRADVHPRPESADGFDI